jgi:hypothetical protein
VRRKNKIEKLFEPIKEDLFKPMGKPEIAGINKKYPYLDTTILQKCRDELQKAGFVTTDIKYPVDFGGHGSPHFFIDYTPPGYSLAAYMAGYEHLKIHRDSIMITKGRYDDEA